MTLNHRTKIALLAYPDPQGLHPNELNWREFARWLLERIDEGRTMDIQRDFAQEKLRQQEEKP